jgi:hypothetical protein
VARGARLPGDAWTPRDWALQQAVDLLDAARCPGCGHPKWLAHDKASRRKWKASATRCYSCDATAARQDELAKGEANRPSAIYFGTTYTG